MAGLNLEIVLAGLVAHCCDFRVYPQCLVNFYFLAKIFANLIFVKCYISVGMGWDSGLFNLA